MYINHNMIEKQVTFLSITRVYVLLFAVFLYCFVCVYLLFLCFCLICKLCTFIVMYVLFCSVLYILFSSFQLAIFGYHDSRFFRAFSSFVRQMLGYNSQRRGTACTLPKLIVLFYVLFVCKCVLYYTVLLPPGVNPIAVNKYI